MFRGKTGLVCGILRIWIVDVNNIILYICGVFSVCAVPQKGALHLQTEFGVKPNEIVVVQECMCVCVCVCVCVSVISMCMCICLFVCLFVCSKGSGSQCVCLGSPGGTSWKCSTVTSSSLILDP